MEKRTFLGGLVTGVLLTSVLMNSSPLAAPPMARMEPTLTAQSGATSTPAVTPTP